MSNYTTVAELIAELQKHPPGAVVFAADGFRYLNPTVVRIADTEYGIAPGMKKVAIRASSGPLAANQRTMHGTPLFDLMDMAKDHK